MSRRRAITLCGLAAAVLVNYWVLAPVVGVDHDPGFSWISDLAARGEVGNWRFALLDAASGIAVIALGMLLWREFARRGWARGAPLLRCGLALLIAAGLLDVADALLPVSCARSLGAGCVRSWDLGDDLHELESAASVLVTGGSMVLIGLGLRRRGGTMALALLSILAGSIFLALSGLIALRGSVAELNEIKGWLQRGGQLILGSWLAGLALVVRGHDPGRRPPDPPDPPQAPAGPDPCPPDP